MRQPKDGDLEMLIKTKIAFAAALVLGTASVALAGGNNDGDSHLGGFVHPPSMDGVNPVYHPRWFPAYGHVLRSYDRANAAIYSGAGAYGFVPPATHKHRSRG
jgi:hypothetical protein